MSRYRLKSAFFKGGGQFKRHFRWKGTWTTNHRRCQKIKLITLSCDIKISTVRSFVSQTDGRTDRQIYDLQDCASIYASCGKNHTQKKKWAWSCTVVAIFAMVEATDFKFGTELGFAKSNYKITPKDKRGRSSRLRSSQKFAGFQFNISAVAESSNFKFGTQLRLYQLCPS